MLWFNSAKNITVVSMGYDLGGSNYCGEAYIPGTGWYSGMDSVFPMSVGWSSLQPVLQPTAAQQAETAKQIAAMYLPQVSFTNLIYQSRGMYITLSWTCRSSIRRGWVLLRMRWLLGMRSMSLQRRHKRSHGGG